LLNQESTARRRAVKSIAWRLVVEDDSLFTEDDKQVRK
jgi:hypothetical protein